MSFLGPLLLAGASLSGLQLGAVAPKLRLCALGRVLLRGFGRLGHLRCGLLAMCVPAADDLGSGVATAKAECKTEGQREPVRALDVDLAARDALETLAAARRLLSGSSDSASRHRILGATSI
jgi:hypothetical protein